jgi:hypothetical protein
MTFGSRRGVYGTGGTHSEAARIKVGRKDAAVRV